MATLPPFLFQFRREQLSGGIIIDDLDSGGVAPALPASSPPNEQSHDDYGKESEGEKQYGWMFDHDGTRLSGPLPSANIKQTGAAVNHPSRGKEEPRSLLLHGAGEAVGHRLEEIAERAAVAG
jgi:hypothetical protein